jgi:3',5'-cyclic AMP phosphodiesterase CpdA
MPYRIEVLARLSARMRRSLRSLSVVLLFLSAGCSSIQTAAVSSPVTVDAPQSADAPALALPNKNGTLKFAVFGDFGTAGRREYELAAEMAKFCEQFKVDFVITVGDNLYGAERPQDFKTKFEDPYKTMLDAGIKFYAALGNHDARAQRYYKPFNMDGKLYYSLKAPKEKVRFFFLDSTYPVPEQIDWLEKELKTSNEDWKILVYHHPTYSSGGRHGSDLKLRETLEPLCIKYNVSVVFNGHDHFYERIKPQHDIVYFVVGSGGQLAVGDIDKNSNITAKGFDTDQAFMAAEISGDTMYFNAISRLGKVVDSGTIKRRVPS